MDELELGKTGREEVWVRCVDVGKGGEFEGGLFNGEFAGALVGELDVDASHPCVVGGGGWVGVEAGRGEEGDVPAETKGLRDGCADADAGVRSGADTQDDAGRWGSNNPLNFERQVGRKGGASFKSDGEAFFQNGDQSFFGTGFNH